MGDLGTVAPGTTEKDALSDALDTAGMPKHEGSTGSGSPNIT